MMLRYASRTVLFFLTVRDGIGIMLDRAKVMSCESTPAVSSGENPPSSTRFPGAESLLLVHPPQKLVQGKQVNESAAMS